MVYLRTSLLPLCAALLSLSAEIPYGSNTAAGHYVQTADAKIYYERYGEGGRRRYCYTAASMDTSTSSETSFKR
jgi:hypothetical protein